MTLSSYEKVVLNRKKGFNGKANGGSQRSPTRSKFGIIRDAQSGMNVDNNQNNLITLHLDNFRSISIQGFIKCHVWNPDQSKILAFSSSAGEDSSSIFICSLQNEEDEVAGMKLSSSFQLNLLHTLKGRHDRTITCLDWIREESDNNENHCAKYGQILSCGEDCRAFVWTYKESCNEWIGSQVVLLQNTIPSVPMVCEWDLNYKENNDERRFALGMGGNFKTASVQICHFQKDTNEWISYPIGRKQIKSSVLCLAWQPFKNQGGLRLIACGGCDYRCHIFSISNTKGDIMMSNEENPRFGEQTMEFNTNGGGWVLSVSWSPSGNVLAFSSQSSCIHIVQLSNQSPVLLKFDNYLPMSNLKFYDEENIVVAGYDGKPLLCYLEKSDNREWKFRDGAELVLSSFKCPSIRNDTRGHHQSGNEQSRMRHKNTEAIMSMKLCKIISTLTSKNLSTYANREIVEVSSTDASASVNIWMV